MFFSREEEKQLLREACPLIRNGNQHRFIHRSLLEYGVSLAIFDPQDWKKHNTQEPTLPESHQTASRGSVSPDASLNEHKPADEAPVVEKGLGLDSPLAWRSFVKEPSVLQLNR